MEELFIGNSLNNIPVYAIIGEDGTHFHEYEPGKAMGLLKDVVGMTNIVFDNDDRKVISATHDMGYVVGIDHLVEATDDDYIVYHQRSEDRPVSRMVLNKDPEPTTLLNVVIGELPGTGKCYLYTIYAGSNGEREVGDKSLVTEEDIKKAKIFWSNHALVPTETEYTEILAELEYQRTHKQHEQ